MEVMEVTSKTMKFAEITEAEFDGFAQRHQLGNFVQSVGMAKRRATAGWAAHYVGVYDDAGTLVSAALLHSRHILRGYYDFECAQGPLLDYGNTELVTFFLTELKRWVKTKRALQVRVSPPVLAVHRDQDAKPIEDSYSGEPVMNLLGTLGYRHVPDTDVDSNPAYVRWYFTKDLSGYSTLDDVLKSVDQQTRWSINKARKFGVEVEVLTKREELGRFFDILAATGIRLGFNPRDLVYYESLFDSFGPEQAIFTIAKLNVAAYKNSLREQIEILMSESSSLDETDAKVAGRVRANREQIELYQGKIDDADAMAFGKKYIPLAAAVFMHHGPELAYFMSGSDENYRSFNGPYALQAFALEYALQHGVTRYNFYGTNGVFNNHPEQEGVYKFKYGFGGAIEEQIGHFIYDASPLLTMARRILTTFRR